MRNGQNKRMRGRNNRKNQNPLTRVYESNGPDVKIRGTANHIAEKYIQLARDAQGSGDPIAAENYYQHAEHYFRLIAAAQEQFRQQNPYYQQNQPQQQQGGMPQGADDGYDDGDDDGQPNHMGQNEPYSPQQPQPYLPREGQPFPQQREHQHYQPREGQQHGHGGGRPQYHQQQPQAHYNQQHNQQPQYPQGGDDVGGLPSFITGGGGQQPSPQQSNNGHDGQHDRNQDRFPLHRRRRRHRGPRPDFQNAQGGMGNNEGGDDSPNQPE